MSLDSVDHVSRDMCFSNSRGQKRLFQEEECDEQVDSGTFKRQRVLIQSHDDGKVIQFRLCFLLFCSNLMFKLIGTIFNFFS